MTGIAGAKASSTRIASRVRVCLQLQCNTPGIEDTGYRYAESQASFAGVDVIASPTGPIGDGRMLI